MVRSICQLTVVVRETTPAEEAKIAKLQVNNFKKLTRRKKQLPKRKQRFAMLQVSNFKKLTRHERQLIAKLQQNCSEGAQGAARFTSAL
ncbi:hypothetical protein B296_00025830 [Ensete ventricosum]|uniref:Uncharacterized protein n=1 Tax=Ensete ventricosum TaxID=4639 RepID=A0A426XPK0_ENSVE|nr:hypothetical protein B296_00025830 [Ensete ventricosum]